VKVLPIWSDKRSPLDGDPIGCPVTPEEMVAYLNLHLTFTVATRNLELVANGRSADSVYWLRAFYEDATHRWNLIVFSRDGGFTLMCADNNPYELNDHDYIETILNEEY
jgi:hypothetical protein